MTSIVPGYQYDIFISYRHNDNLDGWVTAFVEHLQRELRATIKEPVSVYFDTNPHDGLSAHHDVDDSLREKLKCLVFIPIVSRTYCDVNSFAWKNEFLPFVNQAQADRFGLKVKLPNGNVTSRVLPLRIHEIEKSDTTLFESVTGSVMRPIDLIYKSAGVNRPLMEGDRREENSNHTLYRDQVNRVANAVDEILTALKGSRAMEVGMTSNGHKEHTPTTAKRNWYAIGAVVLLAMALTFYLTFLRTPALKDAGETGLAVLPFLNNTGEEALNYYGIGMASEIRTKLSMSKHFSFLSSLQATLGYGNTGKSPTEIGSELAVDYLLTGMYQKSGQKLRVDVELLDANNGKVVWTLQVEKEEADIFAVQENIAKQVLAKFNSTLPQSPNNLPTTNLKAYAHYLNGVSLYEQHDAVDEHRLRVLEEFEKAIQLDSSFQEAWAMLIVTQTYLYINALNDDSARRIKIEKDLAYTDIHFPTSWQSNLIHGAYEYRVANDYDKAEVYLSQVLEVDPGNQLALALISAMFKRKFDYSNALDHKRRVLEVNPQLGGEYDDLADVLNLMGDYKNGWRVRLKGWRLGWRTFKANGPKYYVVAEQAFAAGLPPDSIPADYKDFLGEDFDLWLLQRHGEWKKAVALAKKLGQIDVVCLSFQLMNEMDSARYYARQSLKSKLGWPGIFYAVLGYKEQALITNREAFGPRMNTNDDKMAGAFYLMNESMLLGIAGDYAGAVGKIQELNTKYPTFNYYDDPLNNPYFEKIRREYPPFLKVINERKQLPMPDVQEFIKF